MMPMDKGDCAAGYNPESYSFIQECHKLQLSHEEQKSTFLILKYL
jgi:hypothetical protein